MSSFGLKAEKDVSDLAKRLEPFLAFLSRASVGVRPTVSRSTLILLHVEARTALAVGVGHFVEPVR